MRYNFDPTATFIIVKSRFRDMVFSVNCSFYSDKEL